MTVALVSLAGIPPLAGVFGKFLLLKAILEQGPVNTGYYCLAFTAIAGVVISMYYYFGVIRVMYWAAPGESMPPIEVSLPIRCSMYACVAAIIYLGIFPGPLLNWTLQAVSVLKP
jgi:NADH-quinone oxidoreductase subunit N